MVDGIEQGEELPSPVGISHLRKGHGGPDGAMSVLAPVFAHAGEIALDVARIEGGEVKRGIEELYDLVVAADEALVHGLHAPGGRAGDYRHG